LQPLLLVWFCLAGTGTYAKLGAGFGAYATAKLTMTLPNPVEIGCCSPQKLNNQRPHIVPVRHFFAGLQMAANDVGSLLVYDKDRAGPKGDIPQTVDACVGIITERGEPLTLAS
jgi:hypothetical protein